MTFMLFLHWLGGQKRRHRILHQFANKAFSAPVHKQPLFNSAPHFLRYGLEAVYHEAVKCQKILTLKEYVNQGIFPSATTSASANFIFPNS